MSKRNGAAALAACAFLVVGGFARAAEPVTPTHSQPLLLDVPGDKPSAPTPPASPTVPAATTASSESLINDGLARIGVKDWLDKAGIKVSGYVEGSYTYNTRAPESDINGLRAFDFEHDAPRMNQLELSISKGVDVAAAAKDHKFDVGFGVEMIYGADGRLIHANGLNGYNHFSHPENQFDLTQAYLELALPVGNGLDIKLGKFVTPFGFETINPTSNPLFSHSISFGFGIPFTHTGVLASYALSDKVTISGGFTRGWEQATNDNNGAIDFLGGMTYTANDEFKVAVNVSVGPQLRDDNGNYRYVFEAIPTYTPKNSPWTFAADALYAWEEHTAFNGHTAYWYGITGYVGYKVNDMFTPNFRAEWFRDDGGSRTGVDASYYEFTLGVTIKPFPNHPLGSNLVIRPEVRYDYSNKAGFEGGKHDQTTVGLDAIFSL